MGKGVFSNTELIDTLINDLNTLVKNVASGQYIQFCLIVTQMTQKLVNLKTGVESDIDNKNKVIESLKETIRNMGEGVTDVSISEYVEKHMPKAGAEDGSN